MVVQKSNGWVENFESLPKHKVSEIGLKPNEDKKVNNVIKINLRNLSFYSLFQIRIVCISDTHSAVENVELPFKIPDGDILIHAGDFTNYGEVDKVKEFNAWLGTLSHTYKIVVAGNRDISFDSSVVGPDNIFWDKFKHPEINKVLFMDNFHNKMLIKFLTRIGKVIFDQLHLPRGYLSYHRRTQDLWHTPHIPSRQRL